VLFWKRVKDLLVVVVVVVLTPPMLLVLAVLAAGQAQVQDQTPSHVMVMM
jgi:hypothetical protein